MRHASSSGRGGAAPEPGVESDAAQPDGGDSESDASSTPRDAGDTSELIAPVQSPWVPHTDDPSCQHVQVVPACSDGWCRIPAGCFVMGSPEDEVGRGMNTETLTTVHLTHGFLIEQHELTRAEWARTGWQLPEGEVAGSGVGVCDEPECPMTRVSWFGAMLYANWLSEHAEPPLAPCYRLETCGGSPEYALMCESVLVQTESESESVYDCTGYRLPTEPEWEYAARAGARTAFFAGPMSEAVAAAPEFCIPEPALEDWAWYCNNTADNRAQPVGRRGANSWGLQDILGNVDEYPSNPEYSWTSESPATDPWGNVDATLRIGVRGGLHGSTAEMARLAHRSTWRKQGASSTGFRLVRSLPEE